MAYNQLTCSTSLSNTGKVTCNENFGYFAKLLWAKDDFEISTEANALLQATWETAINAKNVYPFPVFESVEPQNEENVFEDLPTGLRVFVRDGKVRERGHVSVPLGLLQNLRSFNNVSGKVFLVTSNGYILGYSPDGSKFKGFDLQSFNVGGLGTTDGSTRRRTPVEWSLQDPAEMLDYGAAIKPTWNPLDLEGLLDVNITIVGTETSSLLDFTVTRVLDGEGVEGLVATDFNFLLTNGSAQTATFAEVSGGAYKYTASATIADGSLNLKAPASQTTGGYESTGAATVDVS